MNLLPIFILGSVSLVAASEIPPCRESNEQLKSIVYHDLPENERATKITFNNYGMHDMTVYWVNYNGGAQVQGVLPAQASEPHNTYMGHAFRILKHDGNVTYEHVVSDYNQKADIYNCGESDDFLYTPGRDKEFEDLVFDADGCKGPSSQWSCVRHVDEEEVSKRDPKRFGFLDTEVRGVRRKGQQQDDTYVDHIPRIPILTTKLGGYLAMNFTKKMRDVLQPWYQASKGLLKNHEPVAGDYLNIHKVPCDKLNLDDFNDIRTEIVSEMIQVLQWWTNKKLKHTSTFGARVYRRGSMLINHVDRHDTHLASAVIQVAQTVDKDGGWPLEVVAADGKTKEVYLQPGQMALYEGARLFHGRPMRFEGDEFANIFTHFAPLDFKFSKSESRHEEL